MDDVKTIVTATIARALWWKIPFAKWFPLHADTIFPSILQTHTHTYSEPTADKKLARDGNRQKKTMQRIDIEMRESELLRQVVVQFGAIQTAIYESLYGV